MARRGDDARRSGDPGGGDEDRLERLRRIFADGSPSEILDRLVDGDPLGLSTLAREKLRAEGLFLDEERLWLRVAARCAYAGAARALPDALEPWLARRTAEAAADLLREQQTEELQALPVRDSEDVEFYAAFARATDTEPELARLACLVLNQRPRAERLVFRALGVEKRTVEQCSADGLGPPEKVAELFRSAVMAVALVFLQKRGDNPTQGGTRDG